MVTLFIGKSLCTSGRPLRRASVKPPYRLKMCDLLVADSLLIEGRMELTCP